MVVNGYMYVYTFERMHGQQCGPNCRQQLLPVSPPD
jgi:hypothetical protein